VNGKKLRVSRLSAEQGGNVRDTNIDLIGLIMEALNKEHEFVYAPPPPPLQGDPTPRPLPLLILPVVAVSMNFVRPTLHPVPVQ